MQLISVHSWLLCPILLGMVLSTSLLFTFPSATLTLSRRRRRRRLLLIGCHFCTAMSTVHLEGFDESGSLSGLLLSNDAALGVLCHDAHVIVDGELVATNY